MASCMISDPEVEWEDVAAWSTNELKGEKPLYQSVQALFWATVYHLWRQRNDLMHYNAPRSEEQIMAHVQWEVR
jgi:hypothetical protein